MKKSYIILSEDNQWLSTGYDKTQEEIDEDVKQVRQGLIEDGVYKEGEDYALLLFEIEGTSIHV